MIPDGSPAVYSGGVRGWWWFIIAPLALVVGLLVVLLGSMAVTTSTTTQQQAALAPFYTPPDPIPATVGAVVRTEPLGVDVPGATALRMLYVSERPDGTPAVSGGMVFIPTSPPPADGRPVVAWAHGTVGMGDACAPSRSSNPLLDTEGWLEQMMSLGWVVVSTDYTGLGTPGPELYLVGEAEARDVLNAVRAVRSIPDADASARFALWGHSQGGHSVLWSAHRASELAPDLELVGVAAAAPAAELIDIIGAQWNTVIGWAIGAEVAVAWPAADPALQPADVVSVAGMNSYERLADECSYDKSLLAEAVIREAAGKQFFSSNPVANTEWRDYAQSQIPPVLPDSIPVFMAQGTGDEVVLAWPNAVFQERWCAAGANLSTLWMGGVGHLQAADAAGPEVVRWLSDRFDGRPAERNCDFPPPVAPRAPATTP